MKIAKPRAEEWDDVPVTLPYADANYRSLGVADMAHAILDNRPHRASGELALHVLEVMEAFETASRSERIVDITTTVERPAPLSELLKNGQSASIACGLPSPARGEGRTTFTCPGPQSRASTMIRSSA